MHRLALHLLALKPQYAWRIKCYLIIDLIETLQLLYNVIKVLIYGCVKDISYPIDAAVDLWYSEHIAKKKELRRRMKISNKRQQNKMKHQSKKSIIKRNRQSQQTHY